MSSAQGSPSLGPALVSAGPAIPPRTSSRGLSGSATDSPQLSASSGTATPTAPVSDTTPRQAHALPAPSIEEWSRSFDFSLERSTDLRPNPCYLASADDPSTASTLSHSSRSYTTASAGGSETGLSTSASASRLVRGGSGGSGKLLRDNLTRPSGAVSSDALTSSSTARPSSVSIADLLTVVSHASIMAARSTPGSRSSLNLASGNRHRRTASSDEAGGDTENDDDSDGAGEQMRPRGVVTSVSMSELAALRMAISTATSTRSATEPPASTSQPVDAASDGPPRVRTDMLDRGSSRSGTLPTQHHSQQLYQPRDRSTSTSTLACPPSASTITSQSTVRSGDSRRSKLDTVRRGLKRVRHMFSASSPSILVDPLDNGSGFPTDGRSSFLAPAIPTTEPMELTSYFLPQSESFANLTDRATINLYFAADTAALEFTFDVSLSPNKCLASIDLVRSRVYETLRLLPMPSTLYYYDPKLPGLRIEAKHSDNIDALMQAHHDWRLIPNDHVFTLAVALPSSDRVQTIQYQRDLLVADAVAQLADVFQLTHVTGNTNNLFVNSNVGYWLEPTRRLADYEFKPTDKVELRSNSELVYVRVHVPELDTRFVVKSPPHFSVAEFVSLIKYNLKSKNLHLQHNTQQYSLWMTHGHQWLQEHDKIGDHAALLSIREISDCGLEFRVHHRTLDVQCPALDAVAYLSASESATLRDIDTLLSLDTCTAGDDNLLIASLAGEELNPLDNVWDALRQCACKSDFKLRPRYRLLMVTTSVDMALPNARVAMELDFCVPLASLVPTIARKLGLRPSHIRHFLVNERLHDPLLLDRPLGELNLRPLDYLIVEMNEDQWRSDGKRLLDEWELAEKTMTSIWAEGPDAPHNIQVKENTVLAGTLNKLIERATTDVVRDFGEYTSFVQTFFLTYHSFTTPKEVLAKLIDRYHVPRFGHQSLQDFERLRVNIQSRVCNVLKTWTKSYTTAFMENDGSELVAQLLAFTENVMAHDKQYTLGKQIRRNLFKLSTMVAENTRRNHNIAVPLPKIPRGLAGGMANLFVCDPEEVARQLCLSEFGVYRRIKPTELLNQAWMKPDGQSHSPNIWILTQRFNCLARWLTKSLLQLRDLQQRSLRMEWFVEIAVNLLEMRNFLSLMAILAGLGSAPIARLKHTRARMSARARRKLDELEEVMSPQHSHKKYRELYKSPHLNGNMARIPYLSVHLSDLVYVEDGNPDKIDGLINVSKRRLVYGVISTVLEFQDEDYHFATVSDMQRQISLCYVPYERREEELFQWSLEVEPRGWDGITPLAVPAAMQAAAHALATAPSPAPDRAATVAAPMPISVLAAPPPLPAATASLEPRSPIVEPKSPAPSLAPLVIETSLIAGPNDPLALGITEEDDDESTRAPTEDEEP
ncbi:hypothetical protein H9P43_003741 [Blastocladiella emersonii ATCC 22665]|nr:hypothetical protein H9P43_003741 [Blastocladiella emersonii ATCC 22665]